MLMASGEGFVQPRVANQQRGLLFNHAVAHRAADPESFAARGLDHQFVALQRHEHAARRAYRFDRQSHDQVEELGQRHVAGQFATGADQRAHLRAAFDFSLLAQQALQAGGRRGGNDRRLGRTFDKDYGVGGRGRNFLGELERQMSGGNTIARA